MKPDRKQFAICHNYESLVVFGENSDICIYTKPDLSDDSFSDLGDSYELPGELVYKSEEARAYLAGS